MKNPKQEIIKTSHDLFLLNGYKNTSINNIVESLGISKWAFYHHFRDKKSLFLAVMDYFSSTAPKEFYEILWKEVAERQDILRLFEILNESFIEDEFKWGCLLGNMALELSDIDDFYNDKIKSIFIWWEKWLIAHINKIPNFTPKKTPKEIARYMIYSIEWIRMMAKVFKDKNRNKKELDLFLETLDGML